jgi:hypothetical protein
MANINWLEHATAFDFGEVSHYDNKTLKIIKNKGGEWEVRISNYNIDSFGTPVDMIALPVNLRAFYIDRIHFKTKEEALAAWELHCKFIQIQFTF